MKVITLKCASCGAALEISPDMDQFACGYCGSEQIVERRGGTISLKLVTDAITKVQAGTDKTAAELALKRLKEELQPIAIRQAMIESQAEKRANSLVGWGMVGAIIIIIMAIALGSDSGWVAGISVFIILSALIVFTCIGLDSSNRKETEEQLKPILKQRAEIEEKIAKNKAIVDS